MDRLRVHMVAGAVVGVVALVALLAALMTGAVQRAAAEAAPVVPRPAVWVGLMVGAGVLLLGALGAWWYMTRLTRPLARLTGAVQLMAQGVFDRPVRWERGDDLGLLACRLEELRLRVKTSLEERQRWEHALEQQVEERTQEVRLLLGKVISAQEEERRRVSRELHDGAAQYLATLLVVMDGLQERLVRAGWTDDPLVVQAAEQARSALQEIRRLILDLRPAALDDLGLVPALRWYAESRCSRVGLPFTFTVIGRERRLDPALETALFRIAQEAITNVLKHAAARQVGIVLAFDAERLRISVEDDGRGFDPAALAGGAEGAGLDGMRERAALVGGSLEIHSGPGAGTRVTATVPLLPAAHAPSAAIEAQGDG
ncbi:MAG: hypothetical protein HY689_11225 [Chloroflexi bacterium]|nr:hypothetical protein [Chloroflexota bacterium]